MSKPFPASSTWERSIHLSWKTVEVNVETVPRFKNLGAEQSPEVAVGSHGMPYYPVQPSLG